MKLNLLLLLFIFFSKFSFATEKTVDPKVGDSVGKIKAEASLCPLRNFLSVCPRSVVVSNNGYYIPSPFFTIAKPALFWIHFFNSALN